MSRDSPERPSRRHFLGAAAGTVAAVATAGCLGSLVGTSSATEIEPEAPSEPREGSPEEFYYFLEENGIEVTELLYDDDELYLTYRSEAETVEESDDEIMTAYQVYRQALIHRGSDVEFLYTEIENPFDGQAHGWGINSEWIHDYDAAYTDGEVDDDGDEDVEVDAGNETPDDENVTEADDDDMGAIIIWTNIMNSKVYDDDDDGDEEFDNDDLEDEPLELENETDDT